MIDSLLLNCAAGDHCHCDRFQVSVGRRTISHFMGKICAMIGPDFHDVIAIVSAIGLDNKSASRLLFDLSHPVIVDIKMSGNDENFR